jgi:glycosyltransferase involved in cell wall biosynthesis
MRIAYIDPEGYPSAAPASLQVFHTCVGLAAHAEGVWLVGGRGSPPDVSAYYGIPQPSNLVLVRLPRFRWVQGWLRPAWTAPFHFLAVAVVRRLVRREGIEGLLVRNVKLARFLLRAHRRGALPPMVFESHQIFADTMREEAVRRGRDLSAKLHRLAILEAEVYREAAGLIVLTRQLAAILGERFATQGRIQVIPDGVDLRGALPVAEGAAGGPVTYLGNFHPWKGVEILVRAMADAPGVQLRLVGGEPGARARIAALGRDLGVTDRVQLVGPVPPPERWRYLAEASVCVLPLTRSVFGTSFTSPLKLFEYMAAARPVVASDLPALREVLRDGENALLVAPEDPLALAAAIQRLRADRSLAERLASRAAEEVRAYTWEQRGKAILEFLHKVKVVCESAGTTPGGHPVTSSH